MNNNIKEKIYNQIQIENPKESFDSIKKFIDEKIEKYKNEITKHNILLKIKSILQNDELYHSFEEITINFKDADFLPIFNQIESAAENNIIRKLEKIINNAKPKSNENNADDMNELISKNKTLQENYDIKKKALKKYYNLINDKDIIKEVNNKTDNYFKKYELGLFDDEVALKNEASNQSNNNNSIKHDEKNDDEDKAKNEINTPNNVKMEDNNNNIENKNKEEKQNNNFNVSEHLIINKIKDGKEYNISFNQFVKQFANDNKNKAIIKKNYIINETNNYINMKQNLVNQCNFSIEHFSEVNALNDYLLTNQYKINKNLLDEQIFI